MQQDFHEPDHARIVDLDAGTSRIEPMVTGRASRCKKRELDVNVQGLRLEGGEAVGDRQELLAHGGEMVQPFFSPKSERLLEQISLRKKVENFSYCLRNALLK